MHYVNENFGHIKSTPRKYREELGIALESRKRIRFKMERREELIKNFELRKIYPRKCQTFVRKNRKE